jgi:hypothetical protein
MGCGQYGIRKRNGGGLDVVHTPLHCCIFGHSSLLVFTGPIPCDSVAAHSGSMGFELAVVGTRFLMSHIVFIFPLADLGGKPNESERERCRRIIYSLPRMNRVRYAKARTAAPILTSHWSSAVFMRTSNERKDVRCRCCNGGARKIRSHAVLRRHNATLAEP